MRRNIAKKTWGILGKQQTYYSPGQFIQDKPKVPLNNTPIDAWDYKKSKYYRVDLVPLNVQQGGVVPQATSAPVVSPTPTPSITPTNTVTPTITSSPTVTPTMTPSSTPLPLPETPSLWFDASDLAYLTIVPSGGTDYVQSVTSKGTTGWVLQQLDTNRMPIYSGSSRFPGSPNIIRFQSGVGATVKGMVGLNQPTLTTEGTSTFMVFATPPGAMASNPGWNFLFYTGTSVGFYNANTYRQNSGVLSIVQNAITYALSTNNTLNIANFTAASIDFKYLTNQIGTKSASTSTFEINQSGATGNAFPGFTGTTNANTIGWGLSLINSGGTITYATSNIEIAEIMIFNRILSYSEQLQVKSYLRDKWRYDEWNSPNPVPTPTPSRSV